MKNTIKTIVMLLGVATITACCISCNNKTKNESENQANQELSLNEQEDDEQTAHDNYMESLKQTIREKARYKGYHYATCPSADYGEASWVGDEWSALKAILITQPYLTKDDINFLEKLFRENFHDAWVMGRSDMK